MGKTSSLLLVLTSFLAAETGFAADRPGKQGAYIGLFGGFGSASSASLQQKGAVHVPAEFRYLPINARGYTGSGTRVTVGGAHVGYEWNRWNLGTSKWSLKPGAELEGIYLGKHTPTGEMPVTPRFLGTQYVTIPMTATVLLANATLTLQTPYSGKILPYIGLGAGAAFTSIKGSDSANPSEPGINHFNSDPDASDSALALQFKAGIKGEIYESLSLFAEYRHLSIDATSYTFGSTNYPGEHFPTTTWHVNQGRQKYNLFVAGLQYKF